MGIFKKLTLSKLLILVVVSISISFLIKILGFYEIIPWNIAYNDILPWWNYKASGLQMPYINDMIEYPMIIGVLIYLSSRFSFGFYTFFHIFIFILSALISTFYLYKLSRIMKTDKKNLLVYWVLAPSFIFFSFFNWDIIPVMFLIMSLYYYKNEQLDYSAIFLSLSVSAKLFALVLLFPVFLRIGLKRFIRYITIFILIFLTLNSYFMINNFSLWSETYTFHGIREPNIDSIWHVAMNLLDLSIPLINILSLSIFSIIYFYLNIKFRKMDILNISLISILIFLLTNKVFSPQFLLWLLPFFALFHLRLILFYLLELSNLLVLFLTTTHIFSNQDFTIFLIYSGIFVILRHIFLILILFKITDRKLIANNN